METLSTHISYLLRRHDCVIVPGLGAFIATRRPAVIRLDSGMVTPPFREITFNRAVCNDDGLIANSYARKMGLAFEEGRLLMSKDVAALRRNLNVSGKVSLGRLGTITLSDEGSISFSPFYSMETHMRAMGLEKIMLDRHTPAKAMEKEVPTEMLPSISKENCHDNVTPDNSDRYYRLSIPKRFARIAVSFLLVAVISLSLFILPDNRPAREDRASVVNMERMIPAVKTAVVKAASSAQAAVKTELAVPAEEPTSSDRYYLIVATFRTETEAEKYITAYSSPENALRTIKSGKMVRVYSASSDSMNELREELNSESFKKKYREGWIWDSL